MASVINTNVASLNAQRNLNTSQGLLSTALQRLSSGLRINSAKDDAAGLAISERFSTQINGLNQAVRNANDGISLAQTGEGALAEVTNNLQRIREISVQAANATNSAADRQALNLEVQQRLAEIDRTAAQTSFNGQKLLDGSFGSSNFQIGANAGETIGINLSSNVRTAGTGAIATATTTQSVGSTSSGGAVTATTNGTLTFGTTAANAVAGSATVNAATRNFGTVGTPQVDGTSATITHTNLNFGTAFVAQVDGSNVQGTVDGDTGTGGAGSYDFSADLAQFDVDGIGVTLSGDYNDANGLAAAIQGQLGAGYTVDGTGPGIEITKVGSLAAVVVSNTDANAQAAGFADSAGTAGVAETPTTNAQFTVDGDTVTLNANYANTQALADAVTAQLSGYTATVNEGTDQITLTRTGSTAAVAITGADANAVAAGFANSAGTAGSASVGSTNASFSVDGLAVSLTTDYASFDALAADLESKLDTAAGSDTYAVTNSNGTLSIARNAGAGAIAISGANGVATAAGFGNQGGTAGSAAVTSTNASFKVDGTTVTLDQNYGTNDLLRADIQSQLTGYTVSGTGNDLIITNNTAGSAAVAITDADANAIAAGVVNEAGTAGVAGGSITLAQGDFAITVGSNSTVDLAGTYANGKALVDAINSKVQGVLASVDDAGKLTLSSPNALSLTGTRATASGNGNIGFSSGTVAATNGSLAQVSTDTVANALDAIQRVDSALSTISSLRSTFGAVQNRFESVIASQSTTVENLAAARSRIQDADFAAETANLTRAQILQQAGVAILSQANSLPQSVLSLLR